MRTTKAIKGVYAQGNTKLVSWKASDSLKKKSAK